MSRALQARRVTEALKKLAGGTSSLSINELRVIVALERAIARLESHPRLSEHLIFKGGFVLLKTASSLRFTRDVDALALGISRTRIPEMVERALKLDLDDGLWFGDLKIEDLIDQGPYGGYRFNFAFQIGDPPKESEKIRKLSRVHLDVAFGDAFDGKPKKEILTSILPETRPISWSIYPIEVIFAEKLETLFSRGSANSRAKDVYDLAMIFPKCQNLRALRQTVRRTFTHRKTELPESFEKGAQAIDLSILKSAWKSVDLGGLTLSFEETWEKLLECLKTLDQTDES